MANCNSNSGCDLPNIFVTPFGDAPERQSSASIFSDHNPPGDCSQAPQQPLRGEELGFGIGSAEEYENPNSIYLRKRKRREQRLGLDSGGGAVDKAWEIPMQIKKRPKRDEKRSSGFGDELGETGEGEIPDSDMEFEPAAQEAKGRENKDKKRKRDELEADYEEGNYGVVARANGGGDEGLGGKIVGKKRKMVDDPWDMVVSIEGFDDEAKLMRTVLVGNLPLKVKKKVLFKEFSQFGEVESVRIHSIPLYDTPNPTTGAVIQTNIKTAVDSVHAYIVFRTDQASLASLTHNMAVVGGNHIRVDRACPPRKKLKGENVLLYDNKNTAFMGDLPSDVKDRELRTYNARSSLTPSKRKDPSSPGGDDPPSKKWAVNSRTFSQ